MILCALSQIISSVTIKPGVMRAAETGCPASAERKVLSGRGAAQPNKQNQLCRQQKLSLVYLSVETPEGNLPAGPNYYAHC